MLHSIPSQALKMVIYSLGNGAHSFEKISVNQGVENFLKGNGGIRDLSDTSFNPDYLVNANHFMVSNGNGASVNQTVSHSEALQTSARHCSYKVQGSLLEIMLTTLQVLTPLRLKAPTADTHASTKKDVDDEIDNRSSYKATS